MARVVSFSSTFWLTMQQERPERQVTFSSHSMSFKTLVEVAFWQSNIVSEDSRIFGNVIIFIMEITKRFRYMLRFIWTLR